jgi:hypothetical protein
MNALIIFSIVANLASLVGLVVSIMAWWKIVKVDKDLARERKRLAQGVKVVLKWGETQNDRLELPSISRGDLTRAELLGLIGMMPLRNPTERFAIAYISSPQFFSALKTAQRSDGEASLELSCEQNEIERFDLDKWRKLQTSTSR